LPFPPLRMKLIRNEPAAARINRWCVHHSLGIPFAPSRVRTSNTAARVAARIRMEVS
jgi:hypothetical protein